MAILNVDLTATPDDYIHPDTSWYHATVKGTPEYKRNSKDTGDNLVVNFELGLAIGAEEPGKYEGQPQTDWIPNSNMIKLKQLIVACSCEVPDGSFDTEELDGQGLVLFIEKKTTKNKTSGEEEERSFVTKYQIPQAPSGDSDVSESDDDE